MGKTGGRMGKNINYNAAMDSDEEFDISTDDMPANKAQNEAEATSSSFPPGEHPLDGIPGINAAEMPTPDPLPANAAEGYPLDSLGPYIIRCLHSKNWSLREAALAKCCVLISNSEVDVCDEKLIGQFCNLIKAGLSDTISHVLLTALNVLQDCVNAWAEGNLQRAQLGSNVDACLATVIVKFGDASAKVRGEAAAALSFIADASCVGPSHIAGQLTKPMSKKQQNAPKPIAARLALMTELCERCVRERSERERSERKDGAKSASAKMAV
jgi:centrosomal protein CEP104